MKRTPLRRKTPLRQVSSLKTRKGLRRTKLHVAGHSDASELKRDIQATLRDIVMVRDGGCFLRHYQDEIIPQYRNCGPYRQDGKLVEQAEHLHSRGNAISFSDSRLVVDCCQRHHFYYKTQYPDEYYKFARRFIGKERSALLDRVQVDRTPHKVDLKLELIALKQEYKKILEGVNN